MPTLKERIAQWESERNSLTLKLTEAETARAELDQRLTELAARLQDQPDAMKLRTEVEALRDKLAAMTGDKETLEARLVKLEARSPTPAPAPPLNETKGVLPLPTPKEPKEPPPAPQRGQRFQRTKGFQV